EVESERREIVDLGDEAPVDGEVERFHVAVACRAGLDAHARVLVRLEVGQRVRLLLAARRTGDPRHRLLGAAERAADVAGRALVAARRRPARPDPGEAAAEVAAPVETAAARRARLGLYAGGREDGDPGAESRARQVVGRARAPAAPERR